MDRLRDHVDGAATPGRGRDVRYPGNGADLPAEVDQVRVRQRCPKTEVVGAKAVVREANGVREDVAHQARQAQRLIAVGGVIRDVGAHVRIGNMGFSTGRALASGAGDRLHNRYRRRIMLLCMCFGMLRGLPCEARRGLVDGVGPNPGGGGYPVVTG